MAKKVLKSAIIKMCKEVGLTPIEDSWKVDKKSYYDRWNGNSTEIYYSLNTAENVEITADKYYTDSPSFYITHSTQETKQKVVKLLELFEKYGYETNIKISYDNKLKAEVIKLLSDGTYNETLLKIKELLESE